MLARIKLPAPCKKSEALAPVLLLPLQEHTKQDATSALFLRQKENNGAVLTHGW
jgi:hypothetical protein